MKNLLIAMALLTLGLNAQALNLNNTHQQFELVQQNLNEEVFSFSNKLVQFNLNGKKAQLTVINDICRPRHPGQITCMAMPFPVLQAEYKLKQVNTDGCGVRTYVSNKVTNPLFSQESVTERSMIIVKDNRLSICEVAYVAMVEVTLKMNRKDVRTGQSATYESYLSFNPLMTIQPVQ